MTRAILLVGTAKGAFFVESDAERETWDIRGPLCEGWPIHDLIVEPGSGAILAGGGSPWYGPAVWRSEDLGESWTHSSNGLTYGDGAAGDPVATVWSLATAPDGAILAGVEPAGLFRSEDRGATWEHVRGLTEHESRPTWEPGAGGLILHTIVPHPSDTSRTVGRHLGSRGVRKPGRRGTWEPRNSGVRADFNPTRIRSPASASTSSRWPPASPRRSISRTIAAMYRSTDGGLTWTDLSANGLPSDFGFPLVAHPRDPKTFWIIPLNGADRGRFVPDASAAVWKTEDRGDTWQRHDDGLPQHDAYLSVLREAMARDTLDPVGIAFGTKSGQLWHSRDEGRSWERITADLPEIWAVKSLVVD